MSVHVLFLAAVRVRLNRRYLNVFTTRGSSDAIKRGYKQCRMKVGAIDAAALGPF